ncbi:MAG: hypothetical protein A2Z46_02705 [Nitrospirae bacterium RBG_19FT_COMBO_55_12]|nr:MAG: hypothetical protein A2Z46_02705 [Nitrospirae bacterium RBG_19FT_COMBO_55_12]
MIEPAMHVKRIANMAKSTWFPVVLIGFWAALLVAFFVLRPSARSLLFWVLIIPAFVSGVWYLWYSHLQSRSTQRDFSAWQERLDALVDIKDIEDDGHLFEWFDRFEWERIFSEIERMPKGLRSLRKAISAVDPEFVDKLT